MARWRSLPTKTKRTMRLSYLVCLQPRKVISTIYRQITGVARRETVIERCSVGGRADLENRCVSPRKYHSEKKKNKIKRKIDYGLPF